MKTGFRLVAALCAGLILAGCWDGIVLTGLELVTAAAFDAAPAGAMRVTLSIVLPASLQSPTGGGTGASTNSPATATVSAEGGTLEEAVSALALQLPGHIFWGHTRVILIGAGLATRGIAPVVDFLMRSRATRLSTDMVVTRGLAASVLTASPAYRTPGSDALFDALRRRFVARAPVYEVAQSLVTPTSGILIPEVEVSQPSPPAGGPSGGGGSGTTGSSTTPTGFAVAGAGAFQGGRLRDWLTQSQVRGALWLLGRTLESVVRLDAPNGVVVSVKLTGARFNRDAIRLPGGEAAIQVQVDAQDALTQVDAGSPPLGSAKYLLLLSHLLDTRIRQQADAALSLARTDGVDFLGFGRLMAEYQPVFWQRVHTDWPATFPEVPVVLQVRSHVRTTGNLVNLP